MVTHVPHSGLKQDWVITTILVNTTVFHYKHNICVTKSYTLRLLGSSSGANKYKQRISFIFIRPLDDPKGSKHAAFYKANTVFIIKDKLVY
jgi:hypothetical protein